MTPRFLHRLYAWWRACFWMPCPRCGRMFGGHEEFGTPLPDPDVPGKAWVTCDRCILDPVDTTAEQVRAWGYGFLDLDGSFEVIERA